MATDPFDQSRVVLTPEQITELTPLQKKPSTPSKPPRPRASRARFVILPYEQTLKAAGQLDDAPLAVLVELAHQRFKTHRNPVPLPNKALRAAGISRWAKIRALQKLEGLGLVAVTWRGTRCPLVTILWE
jgi:hypothetical protein